MDRILVTGGAGFIGSNIVEALVKKNKKVSVIDNFSTGKIKNIKPFLPKIKLIKGDIRNNSAIDKALKNVDYVLHQAALRSVPRSMDDPISTNDVNVAGTLNLLVACRRHRIKRVVYASSSSVYGDSKKFPQEESDIPMPISPYAASKLAGEYYCGVFARTFGLQTVSLRYFNVIGPRQNPESKYSAVVPKFIEQISLKKPLLIYGDGRQSRDFSYIDNVVSANLMALKVKNISGEVMNIACGETHSVLEIADILERLVGRTALRNFDVPRAGDVKRTRASISKAGRILGYKPLIGFKEGLKKTWEYSEKIKA